MMNKDDFLLNLKRFELLNKIGKGAFGVVYKVREKGKETIYAAKITIQILDEEESPKDTILNLVREVNIISKLKHPSIIRFIGFSAKDFEGNTRPVLITEYMPNGTLRNLIEQERKGLSNPKYDSTKKLIIIYGIASAMSYLHEHNIIHRDLKPDNIFIDENMNPKIGDFGLSKIHHENANSMSTASTKGIKGTPLYIPPETFDDLDYTKKGDVYAFGMIVYEIMTTEKPFNNCTYEKYIIKVSNGERPQIDKTVPQAYKRLIEMCWSQKASERPSFKKIVNDLINERDFIIDTIDECEYFNYVDFVKDCETTYESERHILKYDEFIKNKKLNNKQEDDDDPAKLFRHFKKFYYGVGVTVDMEKACYYCKLAADKEHVDAMFYYGLMLSKGQGVTKNEEEACIYYKMAADKGQISAMYNYGNMLFEGRGVSKNDKEACRYFKMAVDKGHIKSMYYYGFMLSEGLGISKNDVEACKYYKIAADKGHINAMYNYGFMLLEGRGVSKNEAVACRYYKMAADKGDIDALNIYTQLKEKFRNFCC